MRMLRTQVLLAAFALVVGNPASAHADQEALLKVKTLYASAAYEEALAVIAAAPPEGVLTELDQYRVFCLVALGNQAEARVTLEKLLTRNPLYVPNEMETPPRVMETFNEVRNRALPTIARQLYADAKSALEQKDRTRAIDGFEKVRRIAALDGISDPLLADLSVLAEGFLDLSRRLPEPPAAKPEPPSPPAAAAREPVFERPVAISQTMPPWHAPDRVTQRTEFSGSIRVEIGPDGSVTAAQIERPIHPAYDRVLLEAAKMWRYQPARRDGKPVSSDLVVQILLRPEE
jgi:TonB family protein